MISLPIGWHLQVSGQPILLGPVAKLSPSEQQPNLLSLQEAGSGMTITEKNNYLPLRFSIHSGIFFVKINRYKSNETVLFRKSLERKGQEVQILLGEKLVCREATLKIYQNQTCGIFSFELTVNFVRMISTTSGKVFGFVAKRPWGANGPPLAAIDEFPSPWVHQRLAPITSSFSMSTS